MREDLVIVATDDKRIEKHCHEFGMNVVMTSKDCLTGTDRICEVAKLMVREFYINVQGDEPLIESEDILAILETARSQKASVIMVCALLKKRRTLGVLMFLRLFRHQMVIFFI